MTSSLISDYLDRLLPKKALMAPNSAAATCKPCTICSDARKAKEKCIAEKGEAQCKDLIKAHEECLVTNGGTPKNGAAQKNGNTPKNGH